MAAVLEVRNLAAAYGDVIPMIECRNAAQLEEFVEQLLPT